MATGWDEVRWGACMADMKEVDYRNTLAIAALVEVLASKGLIDLDALAAKAAELDRGAEPLPVRRARSSRHR